MTRLHASIKHEIVVHSMRSVRIPTSFGNTLIPLHERKCDSRIRSFAKPGRTPLPLQESHLGPVESPTESDLNQWIREGHTEAQFVEKQVFVNSRGVWGVLFRLGSMRSHLRRRRRFRWRRGIRGLSRMSRLLGVVLPD